MNINQHDSGTVCVAVPEGWSVFAGTDSEGKETQKKLFVYKNAKDQFELFSRAGITVCYFPKADHYFSPKFFYDNVEDMEPFLLGHYLWQGYTCTSLGYPYVMLEGKKDGEVMQVMILLQNGDEKISLSDADVQTIIESIRPSSSE